MRKVLITGGNGQLGTDLVKVFSQDSNYSVKGFDILELDITDPANVERIIQKEKPDLIIHCAAWTDVDGAAKNMAAALRINGEGTRNICLAGKRVGAKVIYISTNEVFDEDKHTPYLETDKPNPITAYGKTKLAGEKFCQSIMGNDCMIVRTSWLYGLASQNNFPNKIIKKAKEQGKLAVVDDEIAVPTYTLDLAGAIKKLVKKNTRGVFHLVNEGQASRYDWAKQIVDEIKLAVSIDRIKLKDFERASKPPAYSLLANTRAKKMGVILRDWRQASREYLQNIGKK